MAPRWDNLQGKDGAAGIIDCSTQGLDEQDEHLSLVQQGWATTPHLVSSGCNDVGREEKSTWSSSLSVGSAVQYARHHTPVGFEHFSPPLHRRRPFGRLDRLQELQGSEEEAEKQGERQPSVTLLDEKCDVDEETTGETLAGIYNGGTTEQRQLGEEAGLSERGCAGCAGEGRPPLRARAGVHLHHHSSLSQTLESIPSRTVAVLSRLPHGGEEAVIYDRRRTIKTLVTIIGGWCSLIFGCFGFKVLAIKVSAGQGAQGSPNPSLFALRLPVPCSSTRCAGRVRPQLTHCNHTMVNSTQMVLERDAYKPCSLRFTFSGVLLGEIALILWGHSIAYMAFRRLAVSDAARASSGLY